MAIIAWILGSLSGLSGIMGIIVAADIIPELANLPAAMTPVFWLLLAILLAIGCLGTLKATPQGFD